MNAYAEQLRLELAELAVIAGRLTKEQVELTNRAESAWNDFHRKKADLEACIATWLGDELRVKIL